jgi:hypothetical protein
MHQLGLEVFISMLVLQQRLDMLVTLTCLDDDHGFCHIVISEGRLIVLNGTINASSTTLARYNGCHERVCTSRNPLYKLDQDAFKSEISYLALREAYPSTRLS